MDRSRGGFGSKFHLVTDGRGTPLAVQVTAGQIHESMQFEATVNAVRIPQLNGPPRRRPKRHAGDKGYSYPRIRQWLRDHSIAAVIAQPRDQRENHRGRPIELDHARYHQRHFIENCVGWIEECRRAATRFEKLALNYLAMLKLAFARRYLKLNLSDRA